MARPNNFEKFPLEILSLSLSPLLFSEGRRDGERYNAGVSLIAKVLRFQSDLSFLPRIKLRPVRHHFAFTTKSRLVQKEREGERREGGGRRGGGGGSWSRESLRSTNDVSTRRERKTREGKREERRRLDGSLSLSLSFSLFFFFGRREMATDFEVERGVARRHLVMELIF